MVPVRHDCRTNYVGLSVVIRRMTSKYRLRREWTRTITFSRNNTVIFFHPFWNKKQGYIHLYVVDNIRRRWLKIKINDVSDFETKTVNRSLEFIRIHSSTHKVLNEIDKDTLIVDWLIHYSFLLCLCQLKCI